MSLNVVMQSKKVTKEPVSRQSEGQIILLETRQRAGTPPVLVLGTGIGLGEEGSVKSCIHDMYSDALYSPITS